MSESLILATAQLLKKNFELPEVREDFSEEALVERLEQIIHQMLNRNFEGLLQICYRIDLEENKLQKILYESAPDQMAYDLASAIVERQKQKIETRRQYSK